MDYGTYFRMLFMVGDLASHALMIAAAVFLYRERSPGTGIMLAGAILILAAGLVQFFPNSMRSLVGTGGPAHQFWLSVITVSAGAKPLFFAGLLLFSVRRRNIGGRVAELERILDRDKRNDRGDAGKEKPIPFVTDSPPISPG